MNFPQMKLYKYLLNREREVILTSLLLHLCTQRGDWGGRLNAPCFLFFSTPTHTIHPHSKQHKLVALKHPSPSQYEKIYLRILPPSSFPHFTLTLTAHFFSAEAVEIDKKSRFSFAQLWLRDLLLVLNSKLTNSTRPQPPRCEWWLMVFCWWWKWNLVLYLIFFFFCFNDQWKT